MKNRKRDIASGVSSTKSYKARAIRVRMPKVPAIFACLIIRLENPRTLALQFGSNLDGTDKQATLNAFSLQFCNQ